MILFVACYLGFVVYNCPMRKMLVGIDEVGRGPLAGPVTVCAVMVPADFKISFFRGITDSKKMTKMSRQEWSDKLSKARREGKIAFCVSSVSARQIDQYGIAPAIRLAIARSLKQLKADQKRDKIFLDGSLKAPKEFLQQKTIIKGDSKNKLISAASVIAKVYRDKYLNRLGNKYPLYGFEIHKGYGTEMHRKAIKKHGMCPEHRWSFCGNLS